MWRRFENIIYKMYLGVVIVWSAAVCVVDAAPKEVQLKKVTINRAYEEVVTETETIAPEPVTNEQPSLEFVEDEQYTKEVVLLYDIPLSDELQLFIKDLCEANNISFELVLAVIEQESTFRAEVMGDGGLAYGLMQIHPQWHQERMDKLGCTDLLNPYENVAVGIDYLAELTSEGKGQTWVLHAYNGGPDYADKLMAAGEVSQYALDVLDKINQLSEEGE